jgi:hypothetical protein
MGRTLVQLEKGTIFWTLDKVDENQHMAACLIGMGEKPSVTVWQHIDFFKVSLACFFCL